MFDIGFFELLLIFVVTLLVFGPEKLPTIVRTAGLYMAKIKNLATKVQDDINQQLQLEELKQELQKQETKLKNQAEEIKKSFDINLTNFEKSATDIETMAEKKLQQADEFISKIDPSTKDKQKIDETKPKNIEKPS